MQLLHAPCWPHLPFQGCKSPSILALVPPDRFLQLSAINFSLHPSKLEKSIWVSHRPSIFGCGSTNATSVEAGVSAVSTGTAENDVLKALSQIIDPDFGTDIVSCGFVKDMQINEALGEVI